MLHNRWRQHTIYGYGYLKVNFIFDSSLDASTVSFGHEEETCSAVTCLFLDVVSHCEEGKYHSCYLLVQWGHVDKFDWFIQMLVKNINTTYIVAGHVTPYFKTVDAARSVDSYFISYLKSPSFV